MMYKRISPLGERVGLGTFETVFNAEKHDSVEAAIKKNDAAVVDFVEDEDGIIYFEAFTLRNPSKMNYYRLTIQHFPFGIDMLDDRSGVELGMEMLRIENHEV